MSQTSRDPLTPYESCHRFRPTGSSPRMEMVQVLPLSMTVVSGLVGAERLGSLENGRQKKVASRSD